MAQNHKDDTAPATKPDLVAVHKELSKLIEESAKETRRHFDVVAEQLTHDYKGIFNDRTLQHSDAIEALKTRVSAIESRLGLIVASR